jgi:outer membrane protein W
MALLVVPLFSPRALSGQSDADEADWRLVVRAAVTSSSYESEPDGYEIYSGVGFDVAVTRRVVSPFWVEVSVRTESREVEGPASPGSDAHLGSLEMLPVEITLPWHPLAHRGGAFQPYLAGGLGVTIVWEKSGALDTTDPPPSLGPVAQAGFALRLAPRVALVFDARWSPLDIEIEGYADPAPRVRVDPLRLGVGIGVGL